MLVMIPNNVIYSFDSYKLTDIEKFGSQFAIPPSKVEYAGFTLPFKVLFRDLNNIDSSTSHSKSMKSKILGTAKLRIICKAEKGNTVKETFSLLC